MIHMDCVHLGFRALGRLCADNEDFYDLLAQIITFRTLFNLWKENQMRNYDRV